MKNMIYRVDVDFIDHEESKKFSSKKSAANFALESAGRILTATIFKFNENHNDWYIIGTKRWTPMRYAPKITWQHEPLP